MGIAASADAVDRVLEGARSGRVKALFVFGADVVGNLGREKVESALEGLELLVLIDIRRSETLLYADVILPAASFAETEGTFTNHAGRVQRFRQAFPPPGQAMEGWRLLASLLQACGDSRAWADAEAVFSAMATEAGAFSGLSYQSLADHGAPLGAPG